jgi:hypothetical protein
VSTEPERRRATRVKTAIQARLVGADGATLSARLSNLSVVGLCATAGRKVEPGTSWRVELHAGGVTVDARGRVARARGRSIAVRFEELPFESFQRLRSFLLAHADDPVVIADELSERLGFLDENA